MTPDQYVEKILAKYVVPRGPTSPAEQLFATVTGPLRTWAGQQLNLLQYSGSYAKETGVRGISDIDVFISLKSDTRETLKELYEMLVSLAQSNGWSPRRQNVSVGVMVNGTRGDLVLGKLQERSKNDHSLYLRKRDSWTQTNIDIHVNTVKRSNRLKEIRAVKIWRMLHGLDFPSLYLEIFVIESLSRHSYSTIAENVIHVLKTFGSSLASARVIDPANTNNILSDDLTQDEKKSIAAKASQSAHEQYWERIIW